MCIYACILGVTDEESLSKILYYCSIMNNFLSVVLLNVFISLKGIAILFSFAITKFGVVPCDGRKMSPRTSSFVPQIIINIQRNYVGISEINYKCRTIFETAFCF